LTLKTSFSVCCSFLPSSISELRNVDFLFCRVCQSLFCPRDCRIWFGPSHIVSLKSWVQLRSSHSAQNFRSPSDSAITDRGAQRIFSTCNQSFLQHFHGLETSYAESTSCKTSYNTATGCSQRTFLRIIDLESTTRASSGTSC